MRKIIMFSAIRRVSNVLSFTFACRGLSLLIINSMSLTTTAIIPVPYKTHALYDIIYERTMSKSGLLPFS